MADDPRRITLRTGRQEFAETHIYNEFGYPYLEGEAPNLKIKIDRRETTYMLGSLTGTVARSLNYFVKQDEGIQWLGYKFTGDVRRLVATRHHQPAGLVPARSGHG